MDDYPTLEQIKQAKERLGSLVIETPATPWRDARLTELIGEDTEVFVKLELFQVTGTFKPRGALNVMLHLEKPQLERGVTAVSAGNHAIATAYAAKALGTTAKVVMPKNANALRMQLSRNLGAEIVLADNPHDAFARVRQIEQEEGRTFIHPFEGPLTLQGTGTAGFLLDFQAYLHLELPKDYVHFAHQAILHWDSSQLDQLSNSIQTHQCPYQKQLCMQPGCLFQATSFHIDPK